MAVWKTEKIQYEAVEKVAELLALKSNRFFSIQTLIILQSFQHPWNVSFQLTSLNTEGAIESVCINGVSVLSRLHLEKM